MKAIVHAASGVFGVGLAAYYTGTPRSGADLMTTALIIWAGLLTVTTIAYCVRIVVRAFRLIKEQESKS